MRHRLNPRLTAQKNLPNPSVAIRLTPPQHVHTMSEEFENGDFTLKTDQMVSVYTTPREFKSTTITVVILNGNHVIISRNVIVFEKLRFQNVFRPTQKRKASSVFATDQ